MESLLKKLNYKSGEDIYLSNTPVELLSSFAEISEQGAINVYSDTDKLAKIDFAILFVQTTTEIEQAIASIAGKFADDPTIWFAYPKSTSKKYKCEFNRDNGWEVLAQYELEPVRQVAISADWSGLRFRLVSNIKTMVRSFALTEAGKQKVEQAKRKRK
jgi:hypothetical protein